MHNATLSTSPLLAAANPLPRFANDWISAWLQFDQSSNLLHIGAGPREWLLEPVEPAKIASVLGSGEQLLGSGEQLLGSGEQLLGSGEQLLGEFNPGLKIALVPGAHQVAGTSFFRLRP
ncbi:hypothetical protein AUR04nite_29700 [Glutamicibacter uratoxydans]|uniref:Uncharacterized protein n=1 Tax=Glutamicibacter uratoxydans TaxID=43667 RepID=A0A4Y4DVN5_GLUUR|nr:hypothetical protein [Glutamicibacter uratoxydans]GED07438.1 hypothetical protein AUR04nite_29700 [Glutamicibacter uratoxydans]